MPNIELHEKHELSTFRKIALGTWKTTYDPSVYGTIDIRMDAALDYLERFRAQTGKRLTVTHMVAKASAAAFSRMPEANALLRFNRPYKRKHIGVFFQVAMTDEGEDKIDLSGAKLDNVDQKDLEQLVDEFEDKVAQVRARKDPSLEKTRRRFKRMPAPLMGVLLRTAAFFSYTLNLDLRWAGIPRDPFGSLLITNIGTLGLDLAYVPLVPYSRVPMLLAVGAVKEVPIVENGAVVIAKMMKVSATFDHRFIDGYHAAIMSRVLQRWLSEPDAHFGELGSPS